MNSSSPRWLYPGLAAVLAAYLIVGTLYAALTPRWQVPDEPAHYNYIRHLTEARSLPVLMPGDYDQEYLETLTGERFPDSLSIARLEYQDHQPPLYYLLAAPYFVLFDGALFPLRWFSLWLGAGVIATAFLVARQVWPQRPARALAAAGFVAFLPQHVSILAGVNNDSLAELILGLTLLLLLRYVELAKGGGEGDAAASARRGGTSGAKSSGEAWRIGVLLGLGFLTKGTIIFAPLLALAALRWAWRRSGWTARRGAREAAAMAVPALAMGGVWWLRNVWVYGWPDLFGQLRHNAVVEGQPRTAEWLAELGGAEYARRFAVTTFDSFWGQFGWMGVVMDWRVYAVLLAFSLLVVAGWGWAVVEGLRRREAGADAPRAAGGLLALTAACSVLVYLGYNLTFVQFQGRYLFSALIPIALAVALGLDRLARLLRPLLGRWHEWLPLGALPLLAALDLLALFRFILPALTQ